MIDEATATRVRAALSRHPTAVDCAMVAASMTGCVADVVVFGGGRAFVVASSAPDRILVPRPMTDAESGLFGTSAKVTDASLAVPIQLDDQPVAALSLRNADPLLSTAGLEPLARMIGAALRSEIAEDHDCRGDFATRVLDGLREAVIVMSGDLRIRWASAGVASLGGFSPQALVGRSAAEFIHEADLERALDGLARMTQGLEIDRLRLRVRNSDGEPVAVEVMATDMSGDAAVDGLVLSLRDANPETELEAEVARSRAVSAAILHRLSDGILATDSFGTVTLANPGAREILGIDADLAPAEITVPTGALFTNSGQPVDLLVERTEGLRCMLPSRGKVRYVDVVTRAVHSVDGDDLGTVVLLTDVTDAHLAAENLRDQALHDQLTGLANRRQLDRVLAELEAAPDPNPVAAAFIDLDGFKLVNDNHGHRIGDLVIRVAADRLAAAMRRGDLLVRQGGDEFVAIITGCTSVAMAAASADRLRSELAKPYLVGGQRFDLTASIGVAVRTDPEVSTDRLLQQADIALYEAKRRGRNRVAAFDDSLSEFVRNEEVHRRLLRSALDDQRIVMHFQPLVDSRSEEVRGYEALARLQTETGELLTPDRFMDSIAHTGLMWELDQAAFRLSCDAARLLGTVSADAAPYVACNFSPVSLAHPDFVDFVIATADDAGVSRDRICIELTESAAFDSGSRSASSLTELRDAGFPLALDDFGTGYSSLAHLRDLPISAVKVDRSFVARLTEDGSERAIAEAIVSLARDLDLSVVAEGVETRAQLDRARAIGFSTIQGWHFAPALPLERCLEQWRSAPTTSEASSAP